MLALPVCWHAQQNSTKRSMDQFSFDVSRIIHQHTVKVHGPYRESCATQLIVIGACTTHVAGFRLQSFLKNQLIVFKKFGYEHHKGNPCTHRQPMHTLSMHTDSVS